MQPEGRDVVTLWDILKASRLIQNFIEGQDRAYFDHTPMCHFAVIAQIEIIGEATKRLSNDFRAAHSSIPWKDIAGMRDILIHLGLVQFVGHADFWSVAGLKNDFACS